MTKFRARSRFRKNPGFVLVVVLTLMILLVMVGVGLLSLASISLRSSAKGESMAVARANARMAVMLALGELQQSLGPDKEITATSGILAGSPARPHLTGVWDSWEMNPEQASPDYRAEKQHRFRRWLVSDADVTATSAPEYPNAVAKGPLIELISAPSATTNGGVSENVEAGRISIAGGGGGFAWHVSDESVKARFNQLRDPSRNATLADKRALVAGHRPGVRAVSTDQGLSLDFFPADDSRNSFIKGGGITAGLISPGQTDLLADSRVSTKLRNDLTPYSLGLLTDVRHGGLKRDLTAAFETTAGLPSGLAGQRLYQSSGGITGPSDPYWSSLSGYYNFYKQLDLAGEVPNLKMALPDPVRIDRDSIPRSYGVAPVIAKMEIVFTFVVRDSHGPWIKSLVAATGDKNLKYMLHMVYLPIVTLYNPYNVELEFDKLTLVVRDVPAAFNFFVNGVPQNKDLVPFNDMFIVNSGGAAGEKAFMLDLANWSYAGESRPSESMKMKPGQTLVCGPFMDPGAGSADTLRATAGTKDSFNPRNTSAALKLRPGFSGKAVGISVDWLTPPESASGQSSDGGLGVLGLHLTDTIQIEAGIRRPGRGEQKLWEVSSTMTIGRKNVEFGGMQFRYDDATTLNKYFPENYKFPFTGSLKASEIYEPYNKPLAKQARGRAAFDFSTAARTCNGGVYETGKREETAGALNTLRDGKLAGKPFLYHNPARAAISVDLKKDHAGDFTHELSFQPLKGEMDDVLEIDALNRGAAITGNTTLTGIKTGALFDLPSGPMQTIAGFRRSNALASSYQPNFVQPVGNSSVSPMMATTSARQPGSNSYDLLDHSFLANDALYDGYYFSTFAPQGGRGASQVFEDFVERRAPLANQCFEPYLPQGTTAAQASADLFSSGNTNPDAWTDSAKYQLVKGAFNVNSTSILAWKAMLSSLNGTKIPVLWAKSLNLELSDAGSAPITALTMPLGGNATDANVDPLKVDNFRTNEWNGYRSLSTYEVDDLAKAIVDEVRARGPFLSMSEFVNRRLGAASEMTRRGALHAAIETSGVNRPVFGQMVPVTEKDISDPLIYNYKTPLVATGNPAEGAPGWISQGDLLHILEPRATVRSDTFVIRACGEAVDGAGKVVSRAYAEAVVQRIPEYVDPSTPPSANAYTDADVPEANRRFGRRMQVVSFRWLSPHEI